MSEKEKVVEILNNVKPTVNLENVQDIIDGGYLDSIELMSLIMSLMEHFKVEISIDEISPENFNSIDAMVALIKRLKLS